MAGATRSRFVIVARGTKQTPSANFSTLSPAMCTARRVFPQPPAPFSAAGVQRATDDDRSVVPCLIGDFALKIQGRDSAISRGPEDGAEGITNSLEYLSTVALDRRTYDLVMTREGDAHRRRMTFPESGAALDVREQERHRTRARLHARIVHPACANSARP